MRPTCAASSKARRSESLLQTVAPGPEVGSPACRAPEFTKLPGLQERNEWGGRGWRDEWGRRGGSRGGRAGGASEGDDRRTDRGGGAVEISSRAGVRSAGTSRAPWKNLGDGAHLVQAAAVQQRHQLVEISFRHIQRLLQGQQRLLRGTGGSPHLFLGTRQGLAPPTSAGSAHRHRAPPTTPTTSGPSPGVGEAHGCPPAQKGTGGQLPARGPAVGSGCWPELAATESASAGRQGEGRVVAAPSPLSSPRTQDCGAPPPPAASLRTCRPRPSPPSSTPLPCPLP